MDRVTETSYSCWGFIAGDWSETRPYGLRPELNAEISKAGHLARVVLNQPVLEVHRR